MRKQERIKVAFASGTDDMNARLVERMRQVFPELRLYVVSEFPPEGGGCAWVRYNNRRPWENLARCRSAFRSKSIRLAGVLLVPGVPFRFMRLIALLLAPLNFLAVNENLNDFILLRPRSVPLIARHAIWRAKNFFRWQFCAQGKASRVAWTVDWMFARAYLAALLRVRQGAPAPVTASDGSEGRDARRCIGDECSQTNAPALAALHRAFDHIPELFCATIDTGGATDEHVTFALAGSTVCSLYDEAKLRELGGFSAPLDVSYRAWQRGWPTVKVAGAFLAAHHAAADSPAIPDENYLRFLVRTVFDRNVFLQLWRAAIGSLRLRASRDERASAALRYAWRLPIESGPASRPAFPEAAFLALANGSVKVFRGRAASGRPRVLVASPYMPFPLSHGGAVRMYNLMRRAAAEFDQILVVFTENDAPPPLEITGICAEVVTVRRTHTHCPPWKGRPDAVEEFSSASFEEAVLQGVRRWRPDIVQLEFTQMGQYASQCAPAHTVLVEHDVTFDLYEQFWKLEGGWDAERQARLWRRFESGVWRQVDRAVTMSEKDRRLVDLRHCVTLPNGVDLDRFQPSSTPPEPRRLLFIGSFAHLPNLMALEFFLRDVWPLVNDARLHVIAGRRHNYYLEHYCHRAAPDLNQPGVEVEGFVSDVRAACDRASVVIVPLVASAGTNIKVLEAMAAGKAIVSTPAGVNGLELVAGQEFLLAKDAVEMAAGINFLFEAPDEGKRLGAAARRRAELEFGWDAIARAQTAFYNELLRT